MKNSRRSSLRNAALCVRNGLEIVMRKRLSKKRRRQLYEPFRSINQRAACKASASILGGLPPVRPFSHALTKSVLFRNKLKRLLYVLRGYDAVTARCRFA